MVKIFSSLAFILILFGYQDVFAQYDYSKSVPDIDLVTEAEEVIEASVIGQLLAQQEIYKNQYGTYWQGLRTFNGFPSSMAEPDVRRKATDMEVDWVDFGIELPSFTKVVTRVDVYEAPCGHGYVFVQEFENSDGALFEKADNFGCEDWRSFDWRLHSLMYEKAI